MRRIDEDVSKNAQKMTCMGDSSVMYNYMKKRRIKHGSWFMKIEFIAVRM